jgi:hypothetical protein
LRVTDSGSLRRLDEEAVLSTVVRRGSDPALSDVVAGEALLSPNEGRVSRKYMLPDVRGKGSPAQELHATEPCIYTTSAAR